MKALNQLKEKFGKIVLKKVLKSKKRIKSYHNFNSAKKVGILFDATDHSNNDSIRNFAKYMSDKKIKVLGLGFAESKEVTDFYKYYTGFSYFTIKDTNWQGIPSGNNVEDFINEEFDIVFDLHLTENFQLDYISSMSHAHFKIGNLTKSHRYDFMIDVSKNPTLDFLCQQIIHYLTIINKI